MKQWASLVGQCLMMASGIAVAAATAWLLVINLQEWPPHGPLFEFLALGVIASVALVVGSELIRRRR